MPVHWAHIYDALIRYFSRYISSCLFKIKHLNGSYDIAKNKIILCIWFNEMCLCSLRFKFTLFSTYCTLLLLLYAPPFWNAYIFTKLIVLRSEACSDWPAIQCVVIGRIPQSNMRWKCYAPYRIVMRVLVQRHKNNNTHYKRWDIITFVAFVASSQDIITDYNDLYCLLTLPCLHLWSEKQQTTSTTLHCSKLVFE